MFFITAGCKKDYPFDTTGTHTTETHVDRRHTYVRVLTGEKVVYVIKKDEIVPGHHSAAVSSGIYTGFQPHKWWLAVRFDELRQECVVTRHTFKAGQGMIIPAHFPHAVHSLPDTLSVHLPIEAIACPVKTRRSEVGCPDNPLLDCRVESDITSDFHFTNRKWTQTCGNR